MKLIKRGLRVCFSLLIKISPVIASKIIFFKTFRRRLNLRDPRTFNEKLMWLKLYEDDSQKTKCTDKYLVRDYVRKSGYSQTLIDLYKVYDKVEQINFDELPHSFVIKCTHGSGFNIICPNKDALDIEQTKLKLKMWMKTNYALLYVERHYSKITPRIIIERFLGDKMNGKVPLDYKIHCFHGEPQIIEIVLNRGTSEQKHLMFNMNWEILSCYSCCVNLNERINKPEKMDSMLEMSRKLSMGFTYVRVDLYFCDNEVYFGELTFTPTACLDNYFIEDADIQMGKLLDLKGLSNRSALYF